MHQSPSLSGTPVLVNYRATREKNFEGKPVISEKTMAVMNESQAHGLIAYWNQLGKRTGDVYELLNLTHYSGSTKHIQWTNSGTGHCYMHIPGSEKIVA
jgi:hypothetical protein